MTATVETTIDSVDLARYNGRVAISNPATGGHRTFRVRTKSDRSDFAPGQRVVELLVGPDNGEDYQPFAFVGDDGRVHVWRKKRGGSFDTFADMLNRAEWWRVRRGLQYRTEVKCRRCNRDLTDPLSIDLGIGPICRGEE